MRKRHGGYVLLCALDELDHTGDDGDYETDRAEDLEESTDAAKQSRGLGDLFARLARFCAVINIECYMSAACDDQVDTDAPWRVFSASSAAAAASSAANVEPRCHRENTTRREARKYLRQQRHSFPRLP